MLKHHSKNALKAIEKYNLYGKQSVYYADVGINRRNNNGDGVPLTGINNAAATAKNKPTPKT